MGGEAWWGEEGLMVDSWEIHLLPFRFLFFSFLALSLSIECIYRLCRIGGVSFEMIASFFFFFFFFLIIYVVLFHGGL